MDLDIEQHPWEPDDKGGGFACIHVEADVYSEKDLDKLIVAIIRQRKWLRRQLKRACMDDYK